MSTCMRKLGIHKQRAKLKALHASRLAVWHSAVLWRRMKEVSTEWLSWAFMRNARKRRCVARQVGTEALTMRKAMRVMKEQAAEMAQRASAAAAAAARERAEADAALGEARTALTSERGRVAELQVCSPLSLSLQAAAAQEL